MTVAIRRCRRLLCALATIAAPGAALMAQVPSSRPAPRTQAWLFSYATAVHAGGRAVGGTGLTLDVAVRNGVARVTFRGGALTALTGARGALLVRAGDTLMSVVNPDKREVFVLPAGQLNSVLGGMPTGGMAIEVSDVASTIRRSGAGPRIVGHETQHVVLEQRFTITAGPATMRRSIRTEQRVELDLSASLARLDPGFGAFAEQVARAAGAPEAARRALRASQRGMPAGFPLHSATTGVSIAGTDSLATTSESLVSGLRREVVDTLLFTVPSDYRVTELSRLLRPGQRR
ncbi:MAG: hypothetical protein IT355_12870 [Gemmatimonadaceae bacterium]|nr:hypothetical protein [Gemmatimonadaceae bacterium]